MEINNIFLKVSGSDVIYPYDIGEYIANNPTTFDNLYSFDDETTESLISSSIYCVVDSNSYPSCSEYQDVIEVTPTQSGSVYVRTYSVVDLTAEEIAQVNESRWDYLREKRDKLLSETDYMALQDTPTLSEEWSTYRQSLRDITNQPDPFNITWPTKP